jgi:hypothetical protein
MHARTRMTSQTCLSTHNLLVSASLIWMLSEMNLYPELIRESNPDGPILLRIRCMATLGFEEISSRHRCKSATFVKTNFSLHSPDQ